MTSPQTHAATSAVCSRCSIEKPASSFTRCAARKNGLSSYCRECHSAYRKARYNPVREKELGDSYRARNKAKISERNAARFAASRTCKKCGARQGDVAFADYGTKKRRWVCVPCAEQEQHEARAQPEKWCPRCQKTKARGCFHKCQRQRNGLDSICKECRRLAGAADWQKHAIRRRAKCRRYANANPDKLWARQRLWRQRNRRKLRERDRWRQRQQIVRSRKAESIRARAMFAASGTVTFAEWLDVLEQFDWCCAYCLSKPAKLTMDHVVPLVRGGKHDRENVVPACAPCNLRKGAHSMLMMLSAPVRIPRGHYLR